MPVPNVPSTPPSNALPKKKEPEIVVIPNEYYGVALKMKDVAVVEEVKVVQAPQKPVVAPRPTTVGPVCEIPPIKHSHWPITVGVIGIFLLIGGGFVYLNKDLLFKKTTTVAVPPAPAPTAPPAAPLNLTASPTGGAVALNWVNPSTGETGYRLERKEGEGSFIPLTNLPLGSNAFLDVSIEGGKNYAYRVVATSPGGESDPSNEAAAQTAAVVQASLQPQLPPGGLDSDSDGLSDVEEGVLGTDIHNPDTDGDGFLDGNEVYHLYNPAAKAPTKLADSGLVTLFSAPVGWSLYAPKQWTTGLNSPDGAKATIDTGHGETFVLTIQDNQDKLSLPDWYIGKHPGVSAAALRSFKTKGGLEGIMSEDRLEALFFWGDKVFSLRYDPDGQAFINFRTLFEVLLNSLKLEGAPTVSVPSDEALGGPGDLTGVTSTVPTEAATTTTPVTSVSAGVVATSTVTSTP